MAEGTQDTVISWNVPNWITVTLMAMIAFALIGLGQKFYASKTAA